MDLRNVAIIAHVDHGKTTLVDAMLKFEQHSVGNPGFKYKCKHPIKIVQSLFVRQQQL